MVLRLLALAAVGIAACVPNTPVVRMAQPTPAALLVVFDDNHSQRLVDPPAELLERLQQVLAARNLTVRQIAAGEHAADLAASRQTGRRLQKLAEIDDAPVVVLVELAADYYSQLAGRYRWNVYAKLSVMSPKETMAPLTEQVQFPAILEFDHEGEADAVAYAVPYITERLGKLLDDFLRSQGGAAPPAQQSQAKGDLIYFALVDRFANGDPRNDGDVDPNDPQAWHGGDLQGLTSKLDYLQALGVRTIWLSPVFQSRRQPFGGYAAFHGYWVQDPERIDTHFGGEQALAELSTQLHRRGMHLLLDMVVNHVSFDSPLLAQHPEWFHHKGGITDWDSQEEVQTHDVHGLPDLAQERPEVFDYLVGASRKLISAAHPDGFRLDAVKHVPIDFWRRYNARLRELGGEGFITLGEMFDGRPEVLAEVQRQGGFSHIFDFATAFALRDVFCGNAPLSRLAQVLFEDREYDDPSRLVTFVDNHDMPRILSACAGDVAATERALSAQFVLRGTPALTYGTEAGLAGKGEPQNRGDMRFGASGNPELFAHIQALAALRAAHPALAAGTTTVLSLSSGALVLMRELGDEALVVAMSSAKEPQSLRLSMLAGCSAHKVDGKPVDLGHWLLPPGAVQVASLQKTGGCAVAAALAPFSTSRRVRFVSDAPLAGIYVAGSGRELGRWQPAAGVPLSPSTSLPAGELMLPVGGVFAFKLVRQEDSAWLWEEGDNRYLFVAPGASPLTVALSPRFAAVANPSATTM